MKTHESKEDLLSVTCNKRSHSGENSEPIPVDLVVEIFLRLPTKTIARCRCASKCMSSILCLPYFTDLFLTRSLARPKLLFSCHKDGDVFFFSSPQPQSLDEHSPLLAANCYSLKVPNEISFDISYSSIRGLVFLRMGDVSVICNPNTGQSLFLPRVKSRRRIGMRSFFGYDPIEKQYKVLSMTWLINGDQWSEEHQVLTLGGTGKPSWRKIECCIPHSPPYDHSHICINGFLYYPTVHKSSRDLLIICFDVRSEKFRFVKNTYGCQHLINYNDKLASLRCYQTFGRHNCRISIKLRVLEDVDKQEWSEHTYVLPTLCNYFVGDPILRVVGMTRTNEIVFSSSMQLGSYYVFYYSIERNTITRVHIQGMEEFKHCCVYTFLDHVDDVKLMNMF